MNREAEHLGDRVRRLAAETARLVDDLGEHKELSATRESLGADPTARAGGLRWGLVLAGGGAKGAYQVGVVEALSELGHRPVAIGGASIGALNGAVLASSSDLRAGASTLARMWREVAATAEAATVVSPPSSWDESKPVLDQLHLLVGHITSPVLDPDFIAGLIARHVDPSRLARGPRLWVTASASTDLDLVTRKFGWLVDLVRARAERQAEWFCVSELPERQIPAALLSSAALPFVFSPRQVGSHRYRDGGLMDNVPIAPLAANHNCELIVVVHLGLGEGFDASRYPGTDLLEIRPRRSLDPPGSLGRFNGLLDFSRSRSEDLFEWGRHDAQEAIRLLRDSISASRRLREGTREVLQALSELEP
jgi:NTE family protein